MFHQSFFVSPSTFFPVYIISMVDIRYLEDHEIYTHNTKKNSENFVRILKYLPLNKSVSLVHD